MTEIVGTCPQVVLIVVPGIGQFDMTTGHGLRAYIAATAANGLHADEEFWCAAPDLRTAIEWRSECP